MYLLGWWTWSKITLQVNQTLLTKHLQYKSSRLTKNLYILQDKPHTLANWRLKRNRTMMMIKTAHFVIFTINRSQIISSPSSLLLFVAVWVHPLSPQTLWHILSLLISSESLKPSPCLLNTPFFLTDLLLCHLGKFKLFSGFSGML